MNTPDNVLFRCRFGSHLHGTNTPSSDLDLKAVFMADVSDIILGRDRETYVHSTGGKDRNTSEDVDTEYIELRKFIRDAMKGQTYAIELLNVNEENVLDTTPLFQEVLDNRDRLITSNVKPFIGYCVSQSKKYGLKGARLQATEDALETLRKFDGRTVVEEVLQELDMNKYVFVTETEVKGQGMVPLLEVNGKQFNMNIPLKRVTPVLQTLLDKYGDRARRAREGVDWKAVSHAYRVIYELKELLQTGRITFPLQEREFLLAVKTGQVPYEQVQEDLPRLIEEVDAIETTLPQQADEEFWDGWLLEKYLG